MRSLLHLGIRLLGLFLAIQGSVQAQFRVQLSNSMRFEFNEKQQTFSISVFGKTVLKDGSAAFQLSGEKPVDLKGIPFTYQKTNFTNASGTGVLYTISNQLPKQRVVNRYFYFYQNSPLIVTQLEIVGKDLSSSKLTPLLMLASTKALGDSCRSVFFPFDNDTFISYDNRPLNTSGQWSSEIGLLYNPQNDAGIVVASLDQGVWKSGVHTQLTAAGELACTIQNGFTDVQITRDSMAHGSIIGDRLLSSKVAFGFVANWRDGLEQFAQRHNKLNPPYVKAWAGGTPFGWNSWGVIQEKLNFDKAIAQVDYFAQEIPAFRNDQGQAFIDLDSFWDNMVDGGMSGDYTKLTEFVAYCQAHQLEPGVYWAPFTDWGHAAGPDRKAEGSKHTFGEMWTKTTRGYHDLDGGRALDPTHPGTQARMHFILKKLRECGFKMIKIDFLAHAAIESTGFYNPEIRTGMQAYTVGMRFLNDELHDQMLIYAAISPSLATASFAHMRRIACDAWSSVAQTEYTLNSLSYAWWQTYLYDYIDADHLVFRNENNETQRLRLVSGLLAGSLILGDDFDLKADWQEQMNSYLQDPELLRTVADGRAFRPIGNAQEKDASRQYLKKGKDCSYLALFNFKPEAASEKLDFAKMGLSVNKSYQAIDLFTKRKLTLKAGDLMHFANQGVLLLKVLE